MKRFGDRGTNALTLLHKLVGFAWAAAAVGVLVLTVPKLASGQVTWNLVAAFGRIGSIASVVTIALALAYGIFTVWGFLGSRWLLAKWALYLVAVAASGYSIRATREQAVGAVVLLAAVQLAALVTSAGIGLFLRRVRPAGRLSSRSSRSHPRRFG